MALFEYVKTFPIDEMQIKLQCARNHLSNYIYTPMKIINHLSRDKQYVLDYYFWDMYYDYIKAIVPDLDKIKKEGKFDIIISKFKAVISDHQPAYDMLDKIIQDSVDYSAALDFIKPRLQVPAKYKTHVTQRQGKTDKRKVEPLYIYQIITIDDLIQMLQEINDDDSRYVLSKIADHITALQSIPEKEMGHILAYFNNRV
jgi:hypothetical protein